MTDLVARALAAVTISLLLPGGCGDDDGPLTDAATSDVGPTGGNRVELGTGITGFVDIPASGGTLELVHGPQGGCHIYLTARMWTPTVDGTLMTMRAVGDAIDLGTSTGESDLTVRLVESRVVREGDHWLKAGGFVVLMLPCPRPPDPIAVVGTTMTVSLRIEPPTGEPAEDSRVVTVVDAE